MGAGTSEQYSGSNIGYTPDYEFITRSAHRKPAPPVRPPALTRHHAFGRFRPLPDAKWYEHIEDVALLIINAALKKSSNTKISNLHDDSISIGNDNTTLRLRLLRSKCQFINGIGSRIGSGSEGNSDDNDPDETEPHLYETVQLTGEWFERTYWIRFEVFEEYFTISVCLGLDKISGVSKDCCEFNGVDKIINDLNWRHVYACKSAEDSTNKRLVGQNAIDTFGAIWDKFQKDFFPIFYQNLLETEKAPLNDLGMEESLFADFRGIVLGIDCNTDIVNHQAWSQDKKVRMPSQTCHHSNHFRKRQRIGEPTFHDYDEGSSAWTEALKPLLMSKDTPTSNRYLDPVEYTFSTFGDGRYIYGSGFGPHRKTKNAAISNEKISYIVLCFHDEWRQIGRLIGRLHTLGTLRLAALLELNRLMTRDSILLRLDEELDQFDQTDRIVTSEDLVSAREKAFAELIDCIWRFVNNVSPDDKNKGATKLTAYDIHSFDKIYMQVFPNSTTASTDVLTTIAATTTNQNEQTVFSKENLRAIESLRKYLLALRKKMTDDRDKTPEKNSSLALRNVRNAIRKAELFLADKIPRFEDAALNHVRDALADMNESIRQGISYRMSRSKYYRELFGSFSKAMRIGRIRGYQPYDIFVEHRLDRAYRHAQSIDERFRQVSAHETRLRKQLNSERSEKHQGVIARFQRIADIGFWLVLAPYYVGSLFKLVVTQLYLLHMYHIHLFQKISLSSEQIGDLYKQWEKCGSLVGAVVALIMIVYHLLKKDKD